MLAMEDATAVLGPTAWLVAVLVAGVVGAFVIHELGHVLAAGALGGERFRLTKVWPVIRVEATLPAGAANEAAFLAAGALANLGGAAALFNAGRAFHLAAALQLVVAVLALIPTGTSDGARLWRLWRGPPADRDQGETGE